MELYESLDAVPSGFGPSAVTIGKFDGLHSGHRAVLVRLLEVARERGLTSVVVTFDRNPLALLAPEKCPTSLISNAQKAELLAASGIDTAVVLTFDRELSAQAPEEFVRTVLVDALHARIVFVGADFRFGSRGSGTVELLQQLGAEHGFEVRLIPEVTDGKRRASSTWIRELLEAGDVAEANRLLGRAASIRSVVVHGQQRGRQLGYPTANLSPDIEGYIPADGVYAAWATVRGTRYGAAVSIGNNPTFEGVPQKQVEAHLLDQKLDLYDESIEVEFAAYIRPMTRFPSAEDLAAQMRRDEARIRVVLGIPAAGTSD